MSLLEQARAARDDIPPEHRDPVAMAAISAILTMLENAHEALGLLLGEPGDPETFATDPDGDCWFCTESAEPIEDHDADGDCPVTQARAVAGWPS